MADEEEWIRIAEFPTYAVSNHGRIINTLYDRIKSVTPNQQGIPSVSLSFGRKQYRRAIAPLVAQAFLPLPPSESFDTPINLDGDRMNNYVENLMWRPRWFAVKYHAQLRIPLDQIYTGAVEDLDTGEVFVSIRDCATRFGLLEQSILYTAFNKIPIFPTGQRFRLLIT